MNFKTRLFHVLITLFLIVAPFSAVQAQPKNILFIYVDDLRPELGAYGATHVQSPNIDTLASQGLRFDRAYVQQAVCHPSRVSTLTGVRPDTAGVTDLVTDFRDRLPDIQTLPQLFKDNGYNAVGFGKIYHDPAANDAQSWSEPTTGFATQYHDPATVGSPPFEEPTNNPPDDDYADAKIANAAIARLETLATEFSGSNKPFFMAVGFLKPHLPFVAPKPYWDLYDNATVPIATGADALPPTNPVSAYLRDGFSGELGSYPSGQPAIGTDPYADIVQYYGVTKIYPEYYARNLYEGYLACVSFIDAQVGKLIAALDDPNNDGNNADSLVNDTIIVLIGDHGFHLGDHGSWPKHTNFEIANRAPLIVKVPGMATAGEGTDSIVEFIDIYPTLAELTGMTLPSHLEGTSFAPILADANVSTKNFAVIQYPRSSGNADYMSYSIRTDRYHYIEWRRIDNSLIAFRELYDHQTDPSENANIALEPANAATITALAADLAGEIGAAAGDMPTGSEVYEGFFYETGILESNDIGGNGFYTGWFGNQGLFNSNSGNQVVDDTTWTTPTGYDWVPFGNTGANSSNGNPPTRALLERNRIDLAQDGTRYFSFLYRPEVTGQTFRLWTYTGTSRAFQIDSQDLNLRLGFADNYINTGFTFTAGQDYLLLGKITASAAGNDSLSLNVYAAGDSVPATEPSFSYTRTADSSAEIDRLTFGIPFNSTVSDIRFDELRIDRSYAAVVGAGTADAPIAYDLQITGTEQSGQTLTAGYTWFDANRGDSESGTAFQWQRSNDGGVTWQNIPGATASSYRTGPPDAAKIVRVAITPGSDTVPFSGGTAYSPASGTIIEGSVSTGLFAHWPFDDQADPTQDTSPSAYTANLNTDNASFVAGKFASGLQLSGSDTAQVGDMPLSGNALSIAAWVKHNGAYNSGTWEMIVGKNWTGLAFGVNAVTGQLRYQIRLSDGNDLLIQTASASATTLVPADTWTHLVGVRDGSSIKLYINGVEQTGLFVNTPPSPTLPINDNADTLYLGSHNNAGGHYWRGVLDEVRIYQRALSAAEVATLVNYDPFNTGDPVSDWKNLVFAGLPEGANDPQAADDADPESDRIPNLAEYAFGLDPFVAELPPVEVTETGFSFLRRSGSGTGTTVSGYSVAGVTYTPGISSDLISNTWNQGPSFMEEVGTPEVHGDGTETVILRGLSSETTPSGPLDPNLQFLRIDLTR